MTRKQTAILSKKSPNIICPPIKATVIVSDDDKFFLDTIDGWSSHNDAPENRGLCLCVNDSTEVYVPYAEIRKFVSFMDKMGL